MAAISPHFEDILQVIGPVVFSFLDQSTANVVAEVSENLYVFSRESWPIRRLDGTKPRMATVGFDQLVSSRLLQKQKIQVLQLRLESLLLMETTLHQFISSRGLETDPLLLIVHLVQRRPLGPCDPYIHGDVKMAADLAKRLNNVDVQIMVDLALAMGNRLGFAEMVERAGWEKVSLTSVTDTELQDQRMMRFVDPQFCRTITCSDLQSEHFLKLPEVRDLNIVSPSVKGPFWEQLRLLHAPKLKRLRIGIGGTRIRFGGATDDYIRGERHPVEVTVGNIRGEILDCIVANLVNGCLNQRRVAEVTVRGLHFPESLGDTSGIVFDWRERRVSDECLPNINFRKLTRVKFRGVSVMWRELITLLVQPPGGRLQVSLDPPVKVQVYGSQYAVC